MSSPSVPAATVPVGPHEWATNLGGIILAFTFALIFRAFVIEGFEIPTGSMAPTLMGQHTLLTSPSTGAVWPAGPVDYIDNTANPKPKQTFATVDPLSGATINANDIALRGGDRVFILKYLFPFYTPSRFDVVVFKNPRNPTMNYIKRLVGLGPEELALVDGDVFSRPLTSQEAAATANGALPGVNTWMASGWNITRKPDASQRVMWQPVYDSAFVPMNAMRDGRVWYRSPWKSPPNQTKDWEIEGKREIRYNGQGSSTLTWDSSVRMINDYYAYNLAASRDLPNGCYPVSDIRLGFYYDRRGAATAPQEPLSATLTARRHEFRWTLSGVNISLEMRPVQTQAWRSLGTATLSAPPGASTPAKIELWHVDQTLSVYIDGALAVSGGYNWSPDERLRYTYGIGAEEVAATKENVLVRYERIAATQLSLTLPGPARLGRVTLDRDIHYQPNNYFAFNDATPSTPPGAHGRAGQPAAATHPRQPVFLNEGEYFMCGDNSPSSLDARLWDAPYGWVANNQEKTGVVSRDALIGHAFIVYWPGMYWWGRIPVPDMGRVRQIR